MQGGEAALVICKVGLLSYIDLLIPPLTHKLPIPMKKKDLELGGPYEWRSLKPCKCRAGVFEATSRLVDLELP